MYWLAWLNLKFFFLFSFFFSENRSKRDVITTLVQRGYPSDPIKAWKELQKSNVLEDGDVDDASSVASSASSAGGPDFNYLLSMSLLSLSREKKEELLKERDNKVRQQSLIRQSDSYSTEVRFPLTNNQLMDLDSGWVKAWQKLGVQQM